MYAVLEGIFTRKCLWVPYSLLSMAIVYCVAILGSQCYM
jgi:hypothetical protein